MPPRKPNHRRTIFIIFLVIAVMAGTGIGLRLRAEAALRHRTDDDALFTVATITPKAGPQSQEVILPGDVRAWHEAPVYARISGYLKDWKTDIGTRVKTGDLLAEIEAPEVDAQLRQAEADLATANANANLAASTAKRWIALRKKDSVSKQEADEKISDASAKQAALAAARANRDRLTELGGFKRVVAPFDGIVTARNTDNGALINAGNGGQMQELFHIADTRRLRIYVQVPQTYVAGITPSISADLVFAEHPGEKFPAKLLKTSDALDPNSRTLTAQFVVENKDNKLLSGGYTQVHLNLAAGADTLRLPVNTLLFRSEGLRVAVVDAQGNVTLKPITLGRDFGKEVEVTAGLNADDNVIVNPPDSLLEGQKVHIAPAKPADADKAAAASAAPAPAAPATDTATPPTTDTAKAPAK